MFSYGSNMQKSLRYFLDIMSDMTQVHGMKITFAYEFVNLNMYFFFPQSLWKASGCWWLVRVLALGSKWRTTTPAWVLRLSSQQEESMY